MIPEKKESHPLDQNRTYCVRCGMNRFGSSQILIVDLDSVQGRFCMICIFRMLGNLLTPLQEKKD